MRLGAAGSVLPGRQCALLVPSVLWLRRAAPGLVTAPPLTCACPLHLPGGMNFDAKLRRESTTVEDYVYAHIG